MRHTKDNLLQQCMAFKDADFVEIMEHKFHDNKEIDTNLKLAIINFQVDLGRQELNAVVLEARKK